MIKRTLSPNGRKPEQVPNPKFRPTSEARTRDWFAEHVGEFGYSIVESGVRFPDVILQDEDGKILRAEIELNSRSFINHRHNPKGCDLVICWEHNAPNSGLPVLELSTRTNHGGEAKEVSAFVLQFKQMLEDTAIRSHLKEEKDLLRSKEILQSVESVVSANKELFLDYFRTRALREKVQQHSSSLAIQLMEKFAKAGAQLDIFEMDRQLDDLLARIVDEHGASNNKSGS